MYRYSPTHSFWWDKRAIKGTVHRKDLTKCLKNHGLEYHKFCGIVRFLSHNGIHHCNLSVSGKKYKNFHLAKDFLNLFAVFQNNLISSEYPDGLPLISFEFFKGELPTTKTAIVMQNSDGSFDDVSDEYGSNQFKVHTNSESQRRDFSLVNI